MEDFLLFVNGTLMRGMPLHENLAGAEYLGEVYTAPTYHLYSIEDRHPAMFEVESDGVSVRGELYRVTEDIWKRVKAGEPPNLYRGKVTLSDGAVVDGILYPQELAENGHRNISKYGCWRTYVKIARIYARREK